MVDVDTLLMLVVGWTNCCCCWLLVDKGLDGTLLLDGETLLVGGTKRLCFCYRGGCGDTADAAGGLDELLLLLLLLLLPAGC